MFFAACRSHKFIAQISCIVFTFVIAEAAIAWAASTKAECENDNLKFELEAYKNEAEILKREANTTSNTLHTKIKTLEMTLKGMQEVTMTNGLIV